MRRLYVMPKETHDKQRKLFSTHLSTYWLALCPTGLTDDLLAWYKNGSQVVVTTEFLGEDNQDRFENHPAVTVLPHPIWYGKEPITIARELPENKNNVNWVPDRSVERAEIARIATFLPSVTGSQWASSLEDVSMRDGIDHLVAAGFGIEHDSTVLDTHRLLATIHPAFRLRGIK